MAFALATGCIIPTNLRSIPAEVNQPPAILEDLCDPQFGPLVPSQPKREVEFKIAVDDPNIDDELRAELYILTVSGAVVTKTFTGVVAGEPFVDTETPTLRRFTFPNYSPCAASGAGTYAVIVTDRAGLTDQNGWTLRCE